MGKYCIYCGKEKERGVSRFYNSATGERIHPYKECDIKDCQHGYHKYTRFLGIFLIEGYSKCKMCGDKYEWFAPISG